MTNPPIHPKQKRNETVQSYLQRFCDYLMEKDTYDRQQRHTGE